jgi:CubicO group peptidase (beta-lactamase class C family)
MKNILSLLSTLLFLIACKKDTSQPQPSSPKDFSSLTTIMQNNLTQLGGNAGLILLDKAGNILYKQYFGSWSDNTYMPIASGSKLPSMAAIMALVDAGQMNLDAKVSLYYPAEFAANDRKNITVRQPTSHTSGFAGSSNWINSNAINLQEATKGIGQGGNINGTATPAAPISYDPNGSQFAYGGVSMQVAGGIAEKVTNKTWDIVFKQTITDKCNMPNTNYTGLGATTNYRIAGGAGTRMSEYANFLLMLLNDGKFKGQQVLSNASVAEILKDQTNGVSLSSSPYEGDPLRQSFRYGLGCWIEEYKNGTPSAFGDQGAFGFSPWIDKARSVVGILFVQKSLSAVNTMPTPETAPYTLLRKKINEILDN